MIRIMIVDDHQILIDGLKDLIINVPDMQIIAEANDGSHALAQLKAQHIDVVLMDISMEKMDGLTATKQIFQKYPKTQVIMLTSHNEMKYISPFVEAGGKGYILKTTDKQELVKAIRTVHEGGIYFNQEVSNKIIANSAKAAAASKAPIRLSDKELEVLRLVCDGLTNPMIASHLGRVEDTVKFHRGNLKRKLKVDNTAQLIRKAIELGLLD